MGSFYRSAHELVFLFKDDTGSHRNNVQLGKFGRYRTNVWNYPGANSFPRSDSEGNLLALHPTTKPVALIADAIKDCTARGDLVLDPFLGSGTAVIAAERCGRTSDARTYFDRHQVAFEKRALRQAAQARERERCNDLNNLTDEELKWIAAGGQKHKE